MVASASLFLLAAAAPGPTIDHQPIDCMVKDRFALVDAALDPAADVASARVYFKSAQDQDSYSVDMEPTQGRFVAKLPKPKDKSSPVTYVIEAVWSSGATRRTAEINAKVIGRRDLCGDGTRTAAEGSGADVRVTSTTSSRLQPKGFKGVASVVALAENAKPADTAAAKPPENAVVPAPRPTPAPVPKSSPDDDYQIGPSDILKINVFGHEDLSQSVIIQSDGTFFFSLIGRVKAADMTPKELERKLTTLLAQGYIRNPQLTVNMQEYRSKNIFVMGEVSRPGSIPYTGNMTVMEMLARAGASAGAGSEVMILRPLDPSREGPTLPLEAAGDASANKQIETLRVNIRDIQMGHLEKNILLRPNDTVFVGQAPRVFVLGEVRSPGAQGFGPGLTVRQAIIQAGGFSADASKGKIVIGRQVDGQYKEIKVKLDDPVQPGDTITIKAKLF